MGTYESRGQRKGDNGDTYQRRVQQDLQDQLDQLKKEIGNKSKIKGAAFGTTGGGLLTYLIMYMLGFNPTNGTFIKQEASPIAATPISEKVDSNYSKITDTRSKLFANKDRIDKIETDLDKHMALQQQWQENIVEKINTNQNTIIEQLKEIKLRLPK